MISWRYSCWLTKCDLYLRLDISPVRERESGVWQERGPAGNWPGPVPGLQLDLDRQHADHTQSQDYFISHHYTLHPPPRPLNILNNISHITLVPTTQLPPNRTWHRQTVGFPNDILVKSYLQLLLLFSPISGLQKVKTTKLSCGNVKNLRRQFAIFLHLARAEFYDLPTANNDYHISTVQTRSVCVPHISLFSRPTPYICPGQTEYGIGNLFLWDES